jgi:hypothetical protein
MRYSTVLAGCAVLAFTSAVEGRGQHAARATVRSIVLDALFAHRALPGPQGAVDDGASVTVESLVRRLGSTLRKHPSAAAQLPNQECLLAIAPDGSVLDEVQGNKTEVELGRAFDARLQRAGARIILVHNHPSSNGLSSADLGQLAKPGVDGIIAIGHDASLYAAAAGPNYDSNRFEATLYPLARFGVVLRLRSEAPAAHVDLTTLDGHIEHVIALALHKARTIRYFAALSDARQDAYRPFAIVCGHVIEAVGRTLGRQSAPS